MKTVCDSILNTSLQVCICGEGLCVVVIFRLIVAMRQADFCDRMLASHFQRFNIPPLFAHLANIRNENVDDICDVDDQLPCTLNSAKLEMPNAGLIFNTIWNVYRISHWFLDFLNRIIERFGLFFIFISKSLIATLQLDKLVRKYIGNLRDQINKFQLYKYSTTSPR